MKKAANLVNAASNAVAVGDYERARELVESALAIEPQLETAHGVAGCVAYMQGRFESAVTHLTYARIMLDTFAPANVTLGQALSQTGRRTEAQQYFKRALELDPNNAEARAEILVFEGAATPKHLDTTESRLLFTPDECGRIIDLGTPRLRQAVLESRTSKPVMTPIHAMLECLIRTDEPEMRFAFDRIEQMVREAGGANLTLWPFARFCKYGPGAFFAPHTDDRDGRPKGLMVAVSVQLSPRTAYTGGDLEISDGTRLMVGPKDQGVAIAFDAMLVHWVAKIKSGARHALICWGTDQKVDDIAGRDAEKEIVRQMRAS